MPVQPEVSSGPLISNSIYSPCDLGDVNEDGNINVVDIVQIVNIILSIDEPSTQELCAGDMNKDGE